MQTYKIDSVCTSETTMPAHLFRYIVNFSKVPYGYFSVLNEVTIHLIAKLELMGCKIPDYIYPDISEGKL